MVRHAAMPVLAGLVGFTAIGCGGAEAVPFEPRKIQLQQLDAADQVIFPRPAPIREMARTEQGFLDVKAATEQEGQRTDRDDAMELLMPSSAPGMAPSTAPATGPSTLPGMVEGDVETVEMSLREAIGKTVIYNYDVSVSAYQPAIEETRVIEAEARFDTIFRQSIEYQRTENEIGGIQSFGGIVTEDTQESIRAETTLQKLLSSGGQAELSFQQTYLDSETAVETGQTLLNPTFETSLTLRFTQPLLRDFGPTVNRARIVINQNNQRIGVLDFREQLETSLLETEEIFWQLYVAREAVEIQRELLEQSMETAERIKNRLGQDADNGQVAQALRQVSQRRQALIQAELQLAVQTIQLKQQVNDPDLPIAGATLILPVSVPLDEPLQFDFLQSLETALLYRTEIGQQLLRVLSARSAMQVARSNIRPRLDLVISGGIQGLDDRWDEAISSQFSLEGPNGAAGLQFEVPLGNREARSVLRRALLQEGQAVEQYAQLVNIITAEIRTAMMTMNAQYLILAETRKTRETAEEQVRVIEFNEREGNAQLTPQFSDLKLRTLDDLANARVAEVQAVANYNIAIARYERSKGTLLRYNNVILSELDAAQRVNPRLRNLIENP